MKRALITLALCWSANLLMAQEILTISTRTTQRPDTLELKLVFDVAQGMHVYAPSSLNLSQGYFIMKLEIDSIPEGLKLLPGHQWPATSFEGGGEVYTGEAHTIICRFTGKVKRTPAVIKGTLHYQACNESTCFPPDEIPFSITVERSAGGRKN